MNEHDMAEMTPLAESAASVHELFLGLVHSGFTEWQALQVIGVMLAEQSRQS
jgi:hypothetical protein